MDPRIKQWGGWHLPASETHLVGWMEKVNDVQDGRHRYQGKKFDALFGVCKGFRTCVDVGAHVGLFSYWAAQRFRAVHAFEPVALHRECFVRNVEQAGVTLHYCALGEKDGTCQIHTAETSSGDSWVSGEGDIAIRRLDDFDEIDEIDCIKLDCEGYELFALRGAEQTIRAFKPAIMVEQKPGHAQRFGLGETAAVEYLQSLGYEVRKAMSGDFIMTHKD